MLGVLLLVAALGPATWRGPAAMVPVPAGPVWMGSDVGERALADALSSPAVREARWFDAELPRQRVTLPAFCLDRVLVTQAQYAGFVAWTGHRAPNIFARGLPAA